MRSLIWLTVIGLIAPVALNWQTTANPVVSSAREIFTRQSKYISAAVGQMPADKYSYHPTPEQWSFGKIASHVAQSSNTLCAILSDSAAPSGPKVSEGDSKETLVAAVAASFEFCDKALAGLQDDQLGDTITFHGAHAPRGRALFELTDDLEDHYSQMAGYIRLNGMLPPSAKPQK